MSIKKCRNKCIFCFVDQLPKGLRKSLYLKDDDYLESFKHGNFITLTNLYEKDICRIIKYNLSPLYVSFHSSNLSIRDIIFNNNNNHKAIDFLKRLDEGNIITNIQIVLCPGINNKTDLLDTLKFLKNFKNINSIGLVPVGVTKYKKNHNLIPFSKVNAIELIDLVNNYIKDENILNVYLSDEFYIISDREFPSYVDYKDFPQIENGIGLVVDFKNSFFSYIDKKFQVNFSSHKQKNLQENKAKNFLLITSEYAKYFIDSLIDNSNDLLKELNINSNYKVNVLSVKNNLFGGNVMVNGLLSFEDIENELKNKKELSIYDKILISDIIFNKEGYTLDNKKRDDFLKISSKIKFIKNNGDALAKELLEL